MIKLKKLQSHPYWIKYITFKSSSSTSIKWLFGPCFIPIFLFKKIRPTSQVLFLLIRLLAYNYFVYMYLIILARFNPDICQIKVRFMFRTIPFKALEDSRSTFTVTVTRCLHKCPMLKTEAYCHLWIINLAENAWKVNQTPQRSLR